MSDTLPDHLAAYADPEYRAAAVASLRMQARVELDMTAPEFDYSLATGGNGAGCQGDALAVMQNIVYTRANYDTDVTESTVAECAERQRVLWDLLWPNIERMVANAKNRRYEGYSDAARHRGARIRYAA